MRESTQLLLQRRLRRSIKLRHRSQRSPKKMLKRQRKLKRMNIARWLFQLRKLRIQKTNLKM